MTDPNTTADLPEGNGATGKQRGKQIAIAVALILSIVCIDQISKSYAITHFKGQPPSIYFGGVLILTYAENPGAFGGLVGNSGDMARFFVLTVGCSVLLLAVAGYLFVAKNIDKQTFYALTLILAGGIGNLIDRIMHETKVIDFLFMQAGPLHTNVFNVADVAITGGFIILLVALIAEFFAKTPENPASA